MASHYYTDTRYQAYFYNLNQDRILVAIRKTGYSATSGVTDLTLAADTPVVLTKTKKKNIITGGAKLHLQNTLTDLYEFAKLHAEAQRTYRLTVRNMTTGVQLFDGWLVDEVFSQKLRKNASVTLAFTDGLAILDRFYPAFLEETDTYFSEMDIIGQCLGFTYLGDEVYVNCTLYADDLSSTENTQNPLRAVYLHRWTFTKNDGTYNNANEILNTILKSYNAILYEKEGKYYIERNVDRILASKTWWGYEIGSSSPHLGSSVTTPSKYDLDSVVLDTGELNYSLIPAAKMFKLNLDYDVNNNLMVNIFDFTAPVNALHQWTIDTAYTDVVTNEYSSDFIKSGVSYTKKIDWDYFDDHNFLQTVFKFTQVGTDETVLNLKFKQEAIVSANATLTFRFRIMLSDGTTTKYVKYDDTNSVWALVDLINIITEEMDSGEEGKTEWNVSKSIDLTGLLSAFEDQIKVTFMLRPTLIEGQARDMVVGDFEMSTNQEEPDNLIENDLNNNKNKEIEDSLRLFDTGSWNYKNCKFREQTVILSTTDIKLITSWTDPTFTSLTLQDHYITQFCNYYDFVRNILELKLYDVTIDVSMVFTTSILQDELSQNISLVIETLEHDILLNAYNVKFVEYISDIGKRIGLNP